jgi:Flp pilus assembly protein TadD
VFFNPHVRDMSYIIHPPAGYVLRTPAMNETVKLGTMTVTKELSAGADGVIKARFHFESGPRRITAAQFEETRAAIGKFENEPALLIMLDQVGQKYLDSGDIAQALGEFRRWTTAHPKEASHHIDMARTLLAAGFGDEARREARKAVEIEPKSSAAHAILAKTLVHDAVGRELKKGVDVPQAIVEYRKAKELDPSSSIIRAELASVLGYNDAGRKYGKGARLAEAIAEYEAMKKDVECNEDAVDRALMALFLRTNEWSRLEELTKKTTDTEMKDAHRLVAIAMLNGAPAAIEAARSIDATKRRNALAQAGSLVAMERNYAVAADLVEAAAQGAPNAAALRQQITILRKSKPIDTLEADPADPATALLQMLMGTRTLKMREAMTKLLSAEAFATFDEKEKEEEDPERDEEFMTFSIDVAIAAIDIQKDGDDKAGYRLRGRIAAQNTDMTVFVVPEKSEWKIAAISTTPPMLALRALRLIESGNLEGARKWLDWARDLIDGSDQDPVATSPFAAIWTRGKAADETTARTAAAVLLPFTKQSAEIALPVLLSVRPDAAPDVQWRIDQALGVAYGLLEKWPELLETADRLAERHPDSATAFEWGYRALYQLKRFDEIEKRANARLARLADDPAALRSLGRLALERGQPAVAQKYFAEVIAKATTPSATDYNEQAWSALFSGSSIPDAIEQARQAVAIAPRHYASLNTLAALYAEQNSSAEARETFLQSLAAGTDEMETQDWYIVGRIAENYGMREPAIEAYRKVEKPKSIEGSSWQLAQKRLEGLAPAKRK